MLQFTVIGNIGGNAELHEENGQKFVSFKVAHNERYVTANGEQRDTTVWVSCVLNGDANNLLPYLVKGQLVFVSGDGSVRTYHSKTQRALVAGVNIRVRTIQLLGSRADAMPRYLFDGDGVQVELAKYYNATGKTNCLLYDATGREYNVDANGWVTGVISPDVNPQSQPTAAEMDAATKADIALDEGKDARRKK